MDSVDKLLAELKAEADPSSRSASQPLSSGEGLSGPPRQSPDESLDALLSQLAEPTQRSVRANLSHHPPTHPLPAAELPATMLPDSRSPEDSLLSEIKSDFEARDQAAALKQQQDQQMAERQRQQQAQAKQQRLEQLKQQRRAELRPQATAWLRTINPRTEEGLWFEEFACGYESRLEAAIDYLEALQEAKRNA